jgi:hypothetical protein
VSETYTVRAADRLPALAEGWDHPAWSGIPAAEVKHARPESSSHRPRTQVRLLHGQAGLRGVFKVEDQYVRSVRTQYQDPVFKDSCVEFFIHPKPNRGYMNLERNAGGAHLCFYIEDHARTPDGFKKFTKVAPALGSQIKIRSSHPSTIEPEIAEPVTWEINFQIPLAVLEHHVGPLGQLSGQTWRGNFYKCAEEVSHPHWLSWNPVDTFNFHLPHCFGALQFA